MTLLVHLLGPAQISRDGDPIDIPGHRPLALLAYLLVTGEAHTRQHLVDLLFEGSDDPRASLRWTLYKLRKAIGPEYLLADRQEIAFNFESDYWLDVTAFEAGQLDLYRGDFLEGLGVREAYHFEDWLLQARQLLAAAGYLDGDGFPTIEALVPHRLVPQSEYLQANWRENLGVEIHWQAIEWNQLRQRLQIAPPNMSFSAWCADYPDPDSFLRTDNELWLTRWRNEVYDRLVEKARRITDQKRRIEMYRQADKILVEEAPLLLLAYPREGLLVKPWIKEYPTSPCGIEIWFGKDVVIEPH